ncbi:hypothetical protein MASR1M6_27160 [Rubrivivax sp.]
MAEVSPAQARAEALEYTRSQRALAGAGLTNAARTARPAASRLRVGFVGGDFRAHPVACFLEGPLEGRGDDGLDLLAFPINDIEDEAGTLEAVLRAWQPISRSSTTRPPRSCARRTRRRPDRLHKATADNWLPVFLRRPASWVAWLGGLRDHGAAGDRLRSRRPPT